MRIEMGYALAAERRYFDDNIDFWLFEHKQNGERCFATGITFSEPHTPGQIVPPSFRLPIERAQKLMDMLWDAGLRPIGGKQSAGAMDAWMRRRVIWAICAPSHFRS